MVEIFDIGSSSVPGSQIGNPFAYTGRQLDEETGLYYYRARHYSAELRRFVQRNSLEYVDGQNAHAYVGGRPAASVDPAGRISGPYLSDGSGGGVHVFDRGEVRR